MNELRVTFHSIDCHTPITAKRLLQQESEEVIKNALKAVNLQLERGNVKNPRAMLKIAIREQWHPEVYKAKN